VTGFTDLFASVHVALVSFQFVCNGLGHVGSFKLCPRFAHNSSHATGWLIFLAMPMVGSFHTDRLKCYSYDISLY